MPSHRLVPATLIAALAALVIGIAPTPLWDEDESRFAAIARTMVETGDWVVPTYNGTLAVDKPVLMHWCMAACMSVFGINEFAARLPSVIATLLVALALARAGRRWFDEATAAVAVAAYVGCLLVSIEAHAATPDAILTALTAWATVLAAEAIMPGRDGRLARTTARRGIGIGLLLGLAVVCKGPIGFVGPLAVLGTWAWCLALGRRLAGGPRSIAAAARAAVPAVGEALVALAPVAVTAGAIIAAAPWYAAVTIRTDGAWPNGFFYVHNVGRFMAPMEKHGAGAWFHPLTMLVGFYPWSCFLPFAVVVSGWRAWRQPTDGQRPATLLALVWLVVWVGGFSAAATKLPNYVLPAYPAAALLVAIVAVDAARRAAAGGWPHPRWMATGLAALAFGGIATAATLVIVAAYGLPGAEPAAAVGLVPLVGAVACGLLATRKPWSAVAAFAVTGLIYASLAVGPAQLLVARGNTLPGFVRRLHDDEAPRLGTYKIASPNVVFYAADRVTPIGDRDVAAIGDFLRSHADAVLLVPERHLPEIEAALPEGHGVIDRTRPAFRTSDVVAIGRTAASHDRTASAPEVIR